MLLTFARSPFAMPPFGGMVSAVGASQAKAVVSGGATVTAGGFGSSVGKAQVAADAQRSVLPMEAGIVSKAVTSGVPHRDAIAMGLIAPVALPEAMARCDFNASGEVDALGVAVAQATRNIRIRYAGLLQAAALVAGEGQTWAAVKALTSWARAHVWGTYYYVGRGASQASAAGDAGAIKERSAGGHVEGDSAALPVDSRRLAIAGGALSASATAIAGARQQIDGVGYQDGVGEGKCVALVSNSVVQSSPSLVTRGRAYAQATAKVARGAVGKSIAKASTTTGTVNQHPAMYYGGATITAAVVGAAVTKAFISSSVGRCRVQAQPAGAVLRVAAAGGVALSVAVERADAVVTTLSAGRAQAVAATAAGGARLAIVAGAISVGAAVTEGGVQLNPLGPSTYKIVVEPLDNRVEVSGQNNIVTVDAIDNLVEAA